MGEVTRGAANHRLAARAAQDLLQSQRWTRAPVDPFAIATNLRIEMQACALDRSFSGCLMVQGTTFGILYSNAIPNDGFQRFTVSHELGHHQLVHHHETLFASGGTHFSQSNFTSTKWYESEADCFAAELLMPQTLFETEIRGHPLGSGAIKGLAQTFRTSWTSTAIRYAQLTPDPVAVIVSEGESVLYCFASEAMRRTGASFIARGTPIPRSSATFRLNLDAVKVGRAEEAEDTTYLSAWFENVREDLEVNEDVIGLGRYGKTMTVLHTVEVPGAE